MSDERTTHDPYEAAVNAARVIEFGASAHSWRVAAERERVRAEDAERKLDAMAMALRARTERTAPAAPTTRNPYEWQVWDQYEVCAAQFSDAVGAGESARLLDQEVPDDAPHTVRAVYLDTPPADTPATPRALVAQLVTHGAVLQTRYCTKSKTPRQASLHVAQWVDMPRPVRILILPDAERAL